MKPIISFLSAGWEPPAIVCDNAKEMIQGEFNRNLKEASHHLRQTEPFAPWANANKREIKEQRRFWEENDKSRVENDFGMAA